MSRAANSVFEITKTLGADDAARIKRLLENGVKLPVQPRVLDELRQLINRSELDVRLLARVINKDPGLTAMLFKVVGNSAYRQHQPFDSVETVLHAVGVRQTFNLVQAIALSGKGEIKKNRPVYEAFWARSHAIGQLAMLVADERVAVCNIFPDQAYLAGIFHDCGVPLLMQRFPTYCAEMKLGTPGIWIDLAEEDQKFNADHCVVGYLVARHWHLPEFICDAIRYHHAIGELGQHEARSMVAIVQLAVDIHYRDQRIASPEWERVKTEVLPELGLSEEALPEFIDIVLERYHGTSEA
ncbi:MAG: HDOD domain-containing protein [Gammaproteobacteria bacterium]|nr:HDOD domain-containing protein [Gammaproteobacteria bacterium]MBU1601301.1 HDOD domain-containing protein [Gammaproteobacteria bacterium]MBU2433882.1 HDOD domain-containing protein [Gammaproteobacteria bacterium]MBU2450600.1 HDOD domain-containing protein [Gammaproteobacteria bacterium]